MLSPDGTRIAFDSRAGDLGPRDTNAGDDVDVRDLATDTTTLVSANAAGDDSGNGDSGLPSFSPDGQRIAFRSLASDLGPTDGNGTFDVYVATLTGADLRVALTATPDPVAAGGCSPTGSRSPTTDRTPATTCRWRCCCPKASRSPAPPRDRHLRPAAAQRAPPGGVRHGRPARRRRRAGRGHGRGPGVAARRDSR